MPIAKERDELLRAAGTWLSAAIELLDHAGEIELRDRAFALKNDVVAVITKSAESIPENV